MSIPSDNPILLARDLGPGEDHPRVSLAIGDGEIVALTRNTPTGDDAVATSSADATVLLRCLAGADAPASGELWIKGVAVHTLRPAARLRYSHAHCAVLPRTSRLLPELSMTDNAALPLLLTGVARAEARKKALAWLDRLEVGEYALARTPELPLAVIRRVAIARALLPDPSVLLADEPLLGLDSADRFHLLRILRAAAGAHGLTLLIATGDSTVADWADRRVPIAYSDAPAVTSAATSAAASTEPCEAGGLTGLAKRTGLAAESHS